MRMLIVGVALGLTVTAANAQAPAKGGKPSGKAAPAHVLLTPGDLKWGPAPPALPAGAQSLDPDGIGGNARQTKPRSNACLVN